MVSRVDWLRWATSTFGCAIVGEAGMSPKYCAALALAVAHVDVAGQHQHRVVRAVPGAEPVLDVLQRGRVKSAIEPIVLWWYGWPAGYIALPSFSQTWP